MTTPITIAYGNAPELMESALVLLRGSGADITIETIEIGQRVYNMDGKIGVLPSSLEVLERNRILLKAPTTAPSGEHEDVSAGLCRYFGLDETHGTLHMFELGDAQATSITSEHFSLFEAAPNEQTHRSILLAAIIMLEHIGENHSATALRNAWQWLLEDNTRANRLKPAEFVEEFVLYLEKAHARARPVLHETV